MTKLILTVLADGFEETEAIATADVLARLGYKVLLAGLDDLQVRGSHGFRICTDVLFHDAPFDEAQAIVLPGGLPGTTNLLASAELKDKICNFRKTGKLVAAICAAPVVLKNAGVLEGKSVTGYPGAEGLLKNTDLKFSPEMAKNTDGIITGKGPGASFLFGAEIARALGSSESEIKQLFDGMFVVS